MPVTSLWILRSVLALVIFWCATAIRLGGSQPLEE